MSIRNIKNEISLFLDKIKLIDTCACDNTNNNYILVNKLNNLNNYLINSEMSSNENAFKFFDVIIPLHLNVNEDSILDNLMLMLDEVFKHKKIILVRKYVANKQDCNCLDNDGSILLNFTCWSSRFMCQYNESVFKLIAEKTCKKLMIINVIMDTSAEQIIMRPVTSHSVKFNYFNIISILYNKDTYQQISSNINNLSMDYLNKFIDFE